MPLLNLLIDLAFTSPHQPELKTVLSHQPETIQQAFSQHDASFIKQQFLQHKNEAYHHERTVAHLTL